MENIVNKPRNLDLRKCTVTRIIKVARDFKLNIKSLPKNHKPG